MEVTISVTNSRENASSDLPVTPTRIASSMKSVKSEKTNAMSAAMAVDSMKTATSTNSAVKMTDASKDVRVMKTAQPRVARIRPITAVTSDASPVVIPETTAPKRARSVWEVPASVRTARTIVSAP
jgi:hypothetical protein